jgi:hypothetical protein
MRVVPPQATPVTMSMLNTRFKRCTQCIAARRSAVVAHRSGNFRFPARKNCNGRACIEGCVHAVLYTGHVKHERGRQRYRARFLTLPERGTHERVHLESESTQFTSSIGASQSGSGPARGFAF